MPANDLLGCCQCRSVCTRDSTECDRLRDGIAAQAVGAVHAPGYLARREEPWNGGTTRADHLCLRIYLEPTHGVVNPGSNLDGVEFRTLNRSRNDASKGWVDVVRV